MLDVAEVSAIIGALSNSVGLVDKMGLSGFPNDI